MKNRVNKKIFKALALAIAATMALSSPISVVAEDGVHQNVINDYGVDTQGDVNKNAPEYNNLETSGSEENNFKKETSQNAQEEAHAAKDIADDVAQTISDSKDAVDKAQTAVDNAQAAADQLYGKKAEGDSPEIESQKKKADNALTAADVAVNGNEKNKGVAGTVEDANKAAQIANGKYVDYVNAANADKNDAISTVEQAGEKLGELGQEVYDYNSEAWNDQWDVWGDAYNTNVNNWNNMQAINAVNEKTEELNERITNATTPDELKQIQTEAKDNVKAANDAVTATKENLKNAVDEYNYYAMKYGKPLYGETTVTYTDKDLEAAGVTQMSTAKIEEDYQAIMAMSISEARIQKAGSDYKEARKAYYDATDDVYDAFGDAAAKINTARTENGKANALQNEINNDLNGYDKWSFNWDTYNWEKEHVKGANEYLKDAQLDDDEIEALLKKIEDGRELVEDVKGREATEDQEAKEGLANEVINYDVDKAQAVVDAKQGVVDIKQGAVDTAQAAVDATQGEINKINAQLNDKKNEDGTVTKGILSQITDAEADRSEKLGTLNSAKNTAITNATNTAKSLAPAAAVARINAEWADLGDFGQWVAGAFGGYQGFYNRRYNDYCKEYVNNYVDTFKKNDLANVEAVKTAQNEYNAADAVLTGANGLYNQKKSLVNQRDGYERTLATQNGTLTSAQRELTSAQGELTAAQGERDKAQSAVNKNTDFAKIYDAADQDARDALVALIREEYVKSSNDINQTEFDEALYDWAEDSRFFEEIIGFVFHIGPYKYEVEQATNARIKMDNKYGEKTWRTNFDKLELIQWLSGTKELKGKINTVMAQYKVKLDEAENRYYDALAADAICVANEAEQSLNASEEALNKKDDGLSDKVVAIQNQISALEAMDPYTDKSREIQALSNELWSLGSTLNGLIENNMFDGRNYQLFESIMTIENAKGALSYIKYQASIARGSVKKIDLVALEWAIKWAEAEVVNANNALLSAQGTLNTVNGKLNPSGNPSDTDDDDTTGGDDTTYIPGVTPRVTPIVANEGEAVLGEARTTTRRSARKSATAVETAKADNNTNNAEVAGAKKEETKTPAVEETKEIEETETALAATPELQEKSFAWWWLLILAAIIAISVEEYARRKHNKAKVNK